MPGPVYARKLAGTAQERWPAILQNFRAVPLSLRLIHLYFIFLFLSWSGQKPHLIDGLIFLKLN